jgi:arylsulfatase A-like enzyme
MYPKLQEQVGTEQRTRYGKTHTVPNRAARRLEFVGSVTAMDAAIGRLLDLLDEYGIVDNTIVIFFSDNGGGGSADNAPLRGRKGQMFEGGIRVPCIVKWPGKIPAGATSDEFLTSLEILPTLCAATAAAPPKGVALDGFDMLPVLQGRRASPRTEMFWQRKLDKAARVGHWKWVESSRGNGLFDLRHDIGERRDLSKERPEILKRVQARFANWKKQMQAAEPRGPFRDF